MKKLLIICGPTATGKTALAIDLAKRFNGELISADSRQVYRGMDIGTGKDTLGKSKVKSQKLKAQIKNKIYELLPYDIGGVLLWMVDVIDPDEEFSVAHYQYLATCVIEDIRKRGKLPIVVGGTGMYIVSILSPIETSHIPPNKQLRKILERYSLEELQVRLEKDAPLVWNVMNESDRQNSRRLVRKIEIVVYPRGKESKIFRDKEKENALIIGLTASYPMLYEKIDQRVDKRVKEGIIGEITSLLEKGYSWELSSMNTFGYKEWKDYMLLSHAHCRMSQKDVVQRWKWDEHGYARRQMTWFKKMGGVHMVDITVRSWSEKVEAIVSSWYT